MKCRLHGFYLTKTVKNATRFNEEENKTVQKDERRTMANRNKKHTHKYGLNEKEESESKTIFRVTNRQTIEMRASLLFARFVLLQFLTFFIQSIRNECLQCSAVRLLCLYSEINRYFLITYGISFLLSFMFKSLIKSIYITQLRNIGNLDAEKQNIILPFD